MHEGARRRDVGGEVLRCHQRQVLEIVAGESWIGLDAGIDEVDARELARAMGGDIVGNHAAGVGPADQHRAFQARGVHHRLDFVAPGLGIPVAGGIERLVGIAVAAQIVGHDAKFPGEIAVDLAHPRQVALGETVDEQDFRTGRVAPFLRRNGQAIRRLHADRLVLRLLPKARLRDRNKKCSDRQSGEATARQGYRHSHSSDRPGVRINRSVS